MLDDVGHAFLHPGARGVVVGVPGPDAEGAVDFVPDHALHAGDVSAVAENRIVLYFHDGFHEKVLSAVARGEPFAVSAVAVAIYAFGGGERGELEEQEEDYGGGDGEWIVGLRYHFFRFCSFSFSCYEFIWCEKRETE